MLVRPLNHYRGNYTYPIVTWVLLGLCGAVALAIISGTFALVMFR